MNYLKERIKELIEEIKWYYKYDKDYIMTLLTLGVSFGCLILIVIMKIFN